MDVVSLVKLLNMAEEGSGRVCSYEVRIIRGGIQPINTTLLKKAGLQSTSLRIINGTHQQTGHPSTIWSIFTHQQSGLGGPADHEIDVRTLWRANVLATAKVRVGRTDEDAVLYPSADHSCYRTKQQNADIKEQKEHIKEQMNLAKQQAMTSDHIAATSSYSCSNILCNRKFISKANMNKHVKAKNCQSGGIATKRTSQRSNKPTCYDNLSVRDIAILCMQETSTFETATVAQTAYRTDSTMMTCRFVPGWAIRKIPKAPPMLPAVKSFFRECYLRGEEGLTKISPPLAVRYSIEIGTEKGKRDNPDVPSFVDACNQTGGRPLFMTVDIPEEPTVRQLYNSWGTQKKQLLKDKQQGAGMTTTQFIAELTHRVKQQEAFVAFSPADIDDLCEYVRALVEDNEDAPNSWRSVIQLHLKDWTGANLTRPHKKQFVDALHLVNMDPTYTQLVLKATRDACIGGGGKCRVMCRRHV